MVKLCKVIYFDKFISNIKNSEIKIIVTTIVIFLISFFTSGCSSNSFGFAMMIPIISLIFMMVIRALFIPTFIESNRCG